MPVLKASASDYTTVVKALANAGAAVSNPQGSRSFSKGSVAFVNTSFTSSLIRLSSFLTVRPSRNLIVQSGPVDPNYTTYVTSLVFTKGFNLAAIARDTSGNFYGRINSRLYYKVSPTGVETFIAGDGDTSYGVFIPGLGAAARFGGNGGTTQHVLDSSGNLFSVHMSTNRIIKIEPNGNATSYAGTGVESSSDGPIGTATFNQPNSIGIDAFNTLYVFESGRKTIRKITSSGQVSTLTFSAAFTPQFSSIAVDSSGIIYVTDNQLHRVYKIIPTGPASADIALLAGSTAGYVNGQGSAAQFNFSIESGICVDAFGNVYVGDTNNGSVRKISPSGNVITISGNGTVGPDSATQLNYPGTPIVDLNDVLYVATASSVRKLTPVS